MADKSELAKAYAAAFAEIEGATKSANNPHYKAKYADLGSVIEAVKPALIKYGLFFTQRPVLGEGGITLETILGHAGGEEMSLGTLFVPANKNDAQAYGSALTYARRYALVTAFGVPVEDDDGNAAARGQSEERTVSPSPSISSADLAVIHQLCAAVGGGQEKLMMDAYKIGSLNDLTPNQAKAAIDRLKEKLAAKVKEETNAMAEGEE